MTFKEKTSLLQFVQDSLGRRRRNGDDETVLDMIQLHLALFLDMSDHLQETTCRAFVQSAVTRDGKSYLSAFDECDEILLRVLREETPENMWVVFNRTCDETVEWRQLRAVVKSIVWSMHLGWVHTVRMLHQLFTFPLRLNLPTAESCVPALLELNASRDHHPSRELQAIARAVVDDDFIQRFVDGVVFQHGNGSTAFYNHGKVVTRLLSLNEKDRRLNFSFIDSFRNTILEVPLTPYPALSSDPITPTPSVVMSVPKSWKKQRIVAIEDTTRMYLQQGVRVGLARAIHTDDFLRRVINFERAELNAELARQASYSRSHATVDLSSASDCVGYQFVRELLGDTPLWPILDRLRTIEFLVPDGTRVKSNIFATMGNAICFPVMTLVLTCICVEALHRSGLSFEQIFTSKDVEFRVYGDDIVIPERAVEHLFELLTTYGFVPNARKTFSGRSPFRESCGGEYLLGEDITPLRISRKFVSLCPDNPTTTLALQPLMNTAHSSCYKMLRFVLLGVVSKNYTRHIPFSYDGRIGVFGVNPRDSMASYPQIWNHGYQRWEYAVDWVAIKRHTVRREDAIAYAEWLLRSVRPRLPIFDGAGVCDGLTEPLITSATQVGGVAKFKPHRYSLTENQISRGVRPGKSNIGDGDLANRPSPGHAR